MGASKRIFAGYAATWEMNKKNTVFIPGCFSRSISAFAAGMGIPLLLGHTAPEPLIAMWRESLPIGRVLALRQDAKGLDVTGVLEPADDHQAVLIEKLLAHELGLSIGSWCNVKRWVKQKGPLWIVNDCLIYEISLTTMPADANEKAYFLDKKIQGEPISLSEEIA
jgi:HK97 family phage prohead protease